MNRTLLAALAVAAVIGTTAGGVTAAQIVGEDGTPPVGEAASSTPATADGVLWATQRVLHDGEEEVRIDLVDQPWELHRVEGGWVVATKSSPQEPSFEVFVVHPDGAATYLADTFLDGDVSPDGRRYAAMRQDGTGYGVWDIASGEQVALVSEAAGEGSWPSGGASFVGDGSTLLTRWTTPDEREQVVSSGVDGGAATLVARGVTGQWSASPDGRHLAATAAPEADLGSGNPACVELRTVRRPGRVTDCDHTFVGAPSFSPSGDAVLAAAAPVEGFGPRLFRALEPGTGERLGTVAAPEAALEARLLDERHAVVLGAENLDGDGTVVYVCVIDGDCEEVGRGTDAAQSAVLGDAG